MLTNDGFTDMIYVLLPVWQAEFALDYAGLGVLRALYVGVLAALQVPSAHLARHLNGRTILALRKEALPPLISLLLTMMHWRSALWVASCLGVLVGVLVRWLMPPVPAPPPALETVTATDHQSDSI